MSERPPVETCRTCDAPLIGTWCHDCGQGHRHVRLSLRELGSEAIEELTSLDTKLVRTARMLTRDPGRVCREYLSGRRVPWMHPFKYALLMATASFLVLRLLLDLVPTSRSDDQALAEQLAVDYGLVFNFLLLPIWAGVTRLLFSRAGLRWIEHYVVALYGFGQLFLLQTCFAPLSLWGASGEIVTAIVTGLMPWPYLSWLAVEVFGASWRRALGLIFLGWYGLLTVMGVLVQILFLS